MGRKQLEIAGTERPKNPEVNAAAEAYVTQRDKRMNLSKKEKEAKVALISVLQKHKLQVYRDDDTTPPLLVTLVPGEDGVRVSEAEPEPEEDADE